MEGSTIKPCFIVRDFGKHMKIWPLMLITTITLSSTALFAKVVDQQGVRTIQSEEKTQLPDNPSLGRVLLYRTGKTIERIGNATQRGADKASNKISQKWNNTQQYRTEAGQSIQQKTTEIKDVTSEKWQETKEVVTGQRPAGTQVPIEQGSLSQ